MKSFDPVWEEIHKSEAWGKYPNEDVVRFVARNFYRERRENIKLLDLGCGAGANAWYLAQEGFDVYAIDGAESAIRKTEEYLRSMKLSAHTAVGDIAALPYPDGMFDGVIDSGAIVANALDGVRAILSECARVLRAGGLMFSTMLFSRKSSGAGTGESLGEGSFRNEKSGVLHNLGSIHYFYPAEILSLYSAAGLNVRSIDENIRTERNGEILVAYYTATARKDS